MVAFRSLAWPTRTAVNRLDRSDLSQTTPSSPTEIETPSVQDLVVQLEAKQEESRRRSSVGDRPTTPNFRILPFRPVILHSRTPSPSTVLKTATGLKGLVPVQKEVGRGPKVRSASLEAEEHKPVPLVFTTAEGETIYHQYSLLPTPPVGGHDIGLEFNPHLPPSPIGEAVKSPVVHFENLPPLPDSPFSFSQPSRSVTRIVQNGTEDLASLASPFAAIRPIAPLSPLNLAVDSAADSSVRSESPHSSGVSRSNTPLSFYRLDPASTVTFNTSVRDLIQEAPDQPIGGKPAAPMDGHAVRTKFSSDKPVESSPSMRKKPLKSRSNHSDSMPGLSRRMVQSSKSPEPLAPSENETTIPRPATPQSEVSMTMVTAPDTPLFGRRNEYSDMSDIAFDRSPGSGTEIKDFAAVTGVEEANEDVCPDCDLPTSNLENAPFSSDLSGPGALASAVSSTGVPPSSVRIATIPITTLPATGTSLGDIPVESLASVVIPVPGISAPDAPEAPRLKGDKGLNIPGSNLLRSLAVPADITGQLDPPGTPVPSKKRMALGKGKRKGQKAVRRGRQLLLRRPVLSLVVGRQLAAPTSTALKLISKGTSIDPTAFKEAAVLQGVPQPVPLPA